MNLPWNCAFNTLPQGVKIGTVVIISLIIIALISEIVLREKYGLKWFK